jgi:transposase InsO family protein
MPWRKSWVVDEADERLKLIAAVIDGELSMCVACETAGVSRKTGYKWLQRYRGYGLSGLAARSRAPHRHGRAMAPKVARLITALRRRRQFWGPRKLKTILERNHPELVIPAASTIGDFLRRQGLSRSRRRRLHAHPGQPFAEVKQPNDLWCADFKGWFRTRDGKRCDPLTISDAYSRFLLECRIVHPSYEEVRPLFERAFRRFGLPRAIRTDNGEPFASAGAAGLSRLSVEWLKAGIQLERIESGKPQQNGRHERMHRTLKAETSSPPAANHAEQQSRFDRFRDYFNCQRPHEALGQTPPSAHYLASQRSYPRHLDDPWYDADYQVLRVRADGCLRWGGKLIYISEALGGELVGIAEIDSGRWLVRFADIDLGILDNTKPTKLQRKALGELRLHRYQGPAGAPESVTYVSGLICHP